MIEAHPRKICWEPEEKVRERLDEALGRQNTDIGGGERLEEASARSFAAEEEKETRAKNCLGLEEERDVRNSLFCFALNTDVTLPHQDPRPLAFL